MRFQAFSPCLYPNAGPAFRLVNSASVNGIELTLYGIGQVYRPHGIYSHIELFAQAVRKSMADIVLFTDAADAFFLADEREILDKFVPMNTGILISAEKNCWPIPSLQDLFPETSYPARYPNAGGYIGYRDTMLDACDKMLRYYTDDMFDGQGCNPQGRWSQAIVDGVVKATIDSKCDIFLPMSNVNLDDVVEEFARFHYMPNDTYPCVIHFNGSAAYRNDPGNALDTKYKEIYG